MVQLVNQEPHGTAQEKIHIDQSEKTHQTRFLHPNPRSKPIKLDS